MQILNGDEQITIGDDTTNPAIKLSDLDGDGGNPYIDFSNDGGAGYDMRIYLDGDDDLAIRGGMTTIRSSVNNPGILRVGEVYYCTSY